MGGREEVRLSRREKILVGLLLLLSLVYAYYNLAYKPGKIARAQLLQANRVLKSLIERGESAKVQNADIEQEKTGIAKLGNELMVAVPAQARIPETVAFLKKTAFDTHVDLKTINYADPNKNKNNSTNIQKNQKKIEKVRILDYNITVQGAYNNLLAFLLKMENAPRLYTISNCQMTTTVKDNDEKTVGEALQQSSIEAEQGAEPLPLSSIPKGSAVNDGNNIKLNLKFSAYYDEETIPGLTTKDDEVPVAAGRINPFI
ncbi:MAG: hypothetical protein ABFD18_08645 [Syntrophomonas sp.]